MNICDFCKSTNVNYNTYIITDDNGSGKKVELCPRCYHELQRREYAHKHQAYEETVKAVGGEIPRKSHWWHRLNRKGRRKK